MSIDVRHLTKRYDRQTAVDQVSFSVSQGEILGFLGPNGAGKSTTMKMITGYLAPDEGEIRVMGQAISPDRVESRKHIGYLPENNPLYLEMYVREYLQYVGSIYRVPNPTTRVDEVIGMTGLRPEAHKLISQLSKGYRQRVGLAQAMLHDPKVLILDEPTSGLDPNQLIEIRALIRELGKTKTILLSTHIMQEVQALCDRVVIIDRGRIVADASIRELSGRTGGTYTLTVGFSATVRSEAWKTIDGYRQHTSLGHNRFQVTGDDPALNANLFDMAVRENIRILEMTAQTESMEHIFHQLTSKES